MRLFSLRYLAAVAAAVFAGAVHAGPIPYPSAGTENPALYNFTATTTGHLTAYFSGSGGASFVNELTMLINGAPSALQGLNNHSVAYGAAFDFGPVRAGDAIVLEMVNLSPGNIGPWYSDKARNSDGANHVYATDFAGDTAVPAGTFVGFEDMPVPGADLNYHDATFVFTNLSVSSVPEPQAWSLMLAGIALTMLKARKRA